MVFLRQPNSHQAPRCCTAPRYAAAGFSLRSGAFACPSSVRLAAAAVNGTAPALGSAPLRKRRVDQLLGRRHTSERLRRLCTASPSRRDRARTITPSQSALSRLCCRCCRCRCPFPRPAPAPVRTVSHFGSTYDGCVPPRDRFVVRGGGAFGGGAEPGRPIARAVYQKSKESSAAAPPFGRTRYGSCAMGSPSTACGHGRVVSSQPRRCRGLLLFVGERARPLTHLQRRYPHHQS
jgi:hypothetical protein